MSAPGDVVLFGTADAGGWVGALRVYSGGFECTLRVMQREPREPMRMVDGRRVPSTVWDGDGALRLEVRYAANGRAGELPGRRPLPGQRPPVRRDGPQLLGVSQRTGGGSPGEWDAQLWIGPLPPGGPVVFSGSWRAAGVEEFRAELDGAPIVAAAAGVTRLWQVPHRTPGDPGRGYREPGPGGHRRPRSSIGHMTISSGSPMRDAEPDGRADAGGGADGAGEADRADPADGTEEPGRDR
ncbi:hypothetical protein [Actinacidiphila yanglinensis]|uniref:hypothetical protein n=1 Tax=Actinacidiphila yanglinensis TaxID=310779 RepID=UPI000CDE5B12|nr:hypothetical protein [Actinacidiphila yanglinensis]